MKSKSLPEQAFLLSILNYDPISGKLYWKYREPDTFNEHENRTQIHQAKVFNSIYPGKFALNSKAKNGYLRGTINSEFYYAHRIIWKMVYGDDPIDIDHDNKIRDANDLINLFSKTRQMNLRNRTIGSNNTSGQMGVSFYKNAWVASITVDNKTIYLGRREFYEDAVAIRKAAELFYNFHPMHGK